MTTEINIVSLSVFMFFFILVTAMGFVASRWRKPDTLDHIDEWGLGGRSFGTWITWFLVGGDFYYCWIDERGCLLALVDCTGHGVPGAFMTMAVNAALNSFSRELLAQHIGSCVADDLRAGSDDKLEELLRLLPKLMK